MALVTPPFPLKTFRVAGMYYHKSDARYKSYMRLVEKDPRNLNGKLFEFRRDPGNRYDSNAIKVVSVDGYATLIGWIPKESNKLMAEMMDKGYQPYLEHFSYHPESSDQHQLLVTVTFPETDPSHPKEFVDGHWVDKNTYIGMVSNKADMRPPAGVPVKQSDPYELDDY